MSTPVRPPITTHVLDTTRGLAAGGIEVTLFREVDGQWNCIRKSQTNSDGRCADLIDRELYSAGRFKLHFDVGTYFQSLHTASLYPFVEIVFDCVPEVQHYHIPLLLNPFGYTTYRGT